MTKIIYMDYQATTPMDERVLEAMLPYFKDKFGNAHSSTHKYGFEAEEAVQKAREQIASLINADPKEIYFTSGATESNNLVLKGTAEFYKQEGKDHIIVSAIEHKCILATAHYLEEKGFKVTYLPVKTNGIVDVKDVEAAITPSTIIVSIMAVNNEIGVVEPLKEIGKICKEKGVLFHTDAAQAIGKIEIDVEDMNISAMSISGHKIYGPKGVGALYVRRKPKTKLLPQIHGGAQERGLRSGTLPVPLCVGMGEACRIAKQEMKEDNKRIKELSDYFFNKLNSSLEMVYLNGDKEKRIPHNLNISFAGVEGESFMMALSNVVAVSSGSACTSASLESSYVLKALNIKDDLAHTSIRFGIGKFTTKEEIDTVAEAIINSINKLREMSPIWEMIKKGIDIEKIKWAEH